MREVNAVRLYDTIRNCRGLVLRFKRYEYMNYLDSNGSLVAWIKWDEITDKNTYYIK